MKKLLWLPLFLFCLTFLGCGSDSPTAASASSATALPAASIGCGSDGTSACVK